VNRDNDNKIGSAEAARRIGISTERLRYWERAGVVKPTYKQCGTRRFRRYSRDDINRARTVRDLVEREKYTLEGAIGRLSRETRDEHERMVQ
jgi:DNA-binding transcriptional MerR regulator